MSTSSSSSSMISSSSSSWFHSAFGSTMSDRSEELEAATIIVPECGICLEKVSDPIALKCGHIFDRHCIKKCLSSGIAKCPYDRKNVQEADFVEKHDIYESTKCSIRAAIFSSENSSSVKIDASIFSSMEEVRKKVISQYLIDSGKKEALSVKQMTVRGSFIFYPGKTLADYQVLPGDEPVMWVFLA
jgi:Ring finger domain